MLEAVTRYRKCAFVSPYANLGIVLGMNIAGYLASSGLRVQLAIEFSIPIDIAEVIAELYGSEATERIVIDRDRVEGLDAYVYVSERDGSSIPWRGRVYAAIPKLGRLPQKLREYIHVYRVRRVDGNTYSFVSRDGIYLAKVDRYRLIDQELPEEVKALHRELVDLYTELGAIKAFSVVNMLRKRYGYSREQAIQIIRKAIAIGVVKYENGYLIPYI